MMPVRSKLEFLKYIFPKYLLLLVILPLLVGIIIDLELVLSISFLVNLIWMLVFTIPYYIFRKLIIYKIAVLFYFLIGFLEIGHWLILDGPLTISSMLNFFNSNSEEVGDFIGLKLNFKLLWLIPHVILFLLALKNAPRSGWFRIKAPQLAFLFFIPAIVATVLFNSFPKTQLVPQILKVGYATAIELKHYNLAIAENKLRKVDAILETQNHNQTFVLILGESCSRNHMSLYGAKVPTNPRLEKRSDLIAFKDVVSAHTYTTLSVPTILSNANLENNISFAESIDLLDVFHSAGFKTYWISNQSPIGIWDNVVSSIASKSDVSTFVNISSNSSQEAILNKSYDSRLFDPFSKALEDKAKAKFIVLHLMGNHNTYSKRYPSNFEVFKGDESRDKIIAEYHNSVLYNDYVVDSLLNILKQNAERRNSLATAIYVSDHGENLYDEQNKIGHDYANSIPRANVEIPFAVWMSDNFISLNASKAETIRTNIDKPFVSDDLFHCILDINNIKIPLFETGRSIFNPNYNDNRKRILADGNDYDNGNSDDKM